jgi:Uma2 family endonuclease
MPTAIAEPIYQFLPAGPPRKRWTRSEVDELERLGVLENQRLELIEGELFDKMGKKQPHVNVATRFTGWIIGVFGFDFVAFEAPIQVSSSDEPRNEPIPDLYALKRTSSPFPQLPPGASDLALVVEISDSSLSLGLTVKARLYARAGIADYWVLDINDRRLIVHRGPVEGRYQSVVAYNDHEQVAPLAAPEAFFPVPEVFFFLAKTIQQSPVPAPPAARRRSFDFQTEPHSADQARQAPAAGILVPARGVGRNWRTA